MSVISNTAMDEIFHGIKSVLATDDVEFSIRVRVGKVTSASVDHVDIPWLFSHDFHRVASFLNVDSIFEVLDGKFFIPPLVYLPLERMAH